jgi:hypothetical protein
MVDRRPLSAAVAALLLAGLAGGCESGTAVDLTLHLEDVELTPSGGYWIDLREPDGRPLEGVSVRFVSWQSGAQTVRVALSRDDHFTGGSQRNVRLVVWAHPAQDQPPIGHGAALVSLTQGRSVAAEIVVRPDPRPVAEVAALVHVRSTWQAEEPPSLAGAPGRGLIIGPQGALPSDWHWHAWFIRPNGESGDERLWLGLLDGSPLEVEIEGDPLLARPFAVEVTAESLPEPLVQPLGWRVGDGRLDESYRAALDFLDPGSDEVTVWDMLHVLGHIHSHARLSATSVAVAGRRQHAEHVFNALVGEGATADLDGNGTTEDPIGDPTGLVPPPPEHDAQPPPRDRYVEILHGLAGDAIEQHGGSGPVNDARLDAWSAAGACGAAALDVLAELAAASRLVGMDEAASATDAQAMHALSVAAFGDPSAPGTPSAGLASCFIERLEATSLFGLEPVPAAR